MKPFNIASKRRVQNLEFWLKQGRITEIQLQRFYHYWQSDGFHQANQYYEHLIKTINQ